MKKLIIKSVVVIALPLLATTAVAAAHTKGAYIEANIGSNYGSVNLFGIEDSAFNGIGFNSNLGYQFNRYLAAEVGYTHYGSSQINAADSAIKVILPANNKLSVFAKAGATLLSGNGGNNTLPYVGLGAAYAITPSLDLSVQAQGASMIFASLGLLSGGVTYHFN